MQSPILFEGNESLTQEKNKRQIITLTITVFPIKLKIFLKIPTYILKIKGNLST